MIHNRKKETDIIYRLYNPLTQLERVREIWTSLLEKCPHSYFLSWAWIETWVTSLPINCNIFLVVGYSHESPVIAFFLGSKTSIRHKFFKVHALSLNSTLIPYIDDYTCIEHNAILIDPEIKMSLKSLLDNIPIKSWDELWIPRYSWTYSPNLIQNHNVKHSYNFSISKKIGYYVDLDKVRSNNNDYLALLSRKRRNSIRRSLREYEKKGKLQIHVAENLEDALRIYDELIQLHQKLWMKRGYMGAFYYEYSVDFYKNLISRRFEKGEILLMKISAGDIIIGCLFQFIYNGKALGIHAGFNFLSGKHYLPGFTCHYYDILHCAAIGLNTYDFLAGAESEYKNSLSTDTYEMQDIVIIRKSMKLQIERLVLSFYQHFRKVKELIFIKLR